MSNKQLLWAGAALITAVMIYHWRFSKSKGEALSANGKSKQLILISTVDGTILKTSDPKKASDFSNQCLMAGGHAVKVSK